MSQPPRILLQSFAASTGDHEAQMNSSASEQAAQAADMADPDALPLIHVGIVSYNSVKDLPQCIQSLRQQTYPRLSITVLDNASSDGSVAWLQSESFRMRLLLSTTNLGFGAGHNQILRSLTLHSGEYYLVLNPDVSLSAHYVERLFFGIRRNDCDWGTGKLLLPIEKSGRQLLYSAGHLLLRDGYAANIGYGHLDSEEFDVSRHVFGAPGAATLISQRLISIIAPEGELFDETMFMYNEDVDLDWRARRQGLNCWYQADATAQHRGSQPNDKLKVEAIGNRYLGVLKNGFLADLFLHNLTIIVWHCILRTIFTPSLGIHLILYLCRSAPRSWKKRQRPAVSRSTMHAWFRWSAQQASGQPTTLGQRWKLFLSHRPRGLRKQEG